MERIEPLCPLWKDEIIKLLRASEARYPLSVAGGCGWTAYMLYYLLRHKVKDTRINALLYPGKVKAPIPERIETVCDYFHQLMENGVWGHIVLSHPEIDFDGSGRIYRAPRVTLAPSVLSWHLKTDKKLDQKTKQHKREIASTFFHYRSQSGKKRLSTHTLIAPHAKIDDEYVIGVIENTVDGEAREVFFAAPRLVNETFQLRQRRFIFRFLKKGLDDIEARGMRPYCR